ncbi:hypothetical protein A3K82_01785 [Candidatus Pacearchaeota archaeon RBG_19FT_COMBO_34_9]|nr:MAG: hypothetical protein A3K82_01785 [Candidatus Pacearchaeota archaeon RBG_19FT_COMBO_34_9]OGJ16712.1 MAG: hypothetical protein A3K74_00660 [Candidatus Pacearchaeota archaeon RBG_13_33_26]
MVGNILRGVVFLILTIFFISLISADFTVGDISHSITGNYAPESNITGWINISLSSEPSNSVIESSLGGTITLIDLIKKISNSGFMYTCSPLSCASNYIASNRENSKTFSLSEGSSVMFGFNLSSTGRNLVSEISSFTLNLASNNPETNKFPLAVDILNDGQKEWQAYKSSGNFWDENFGCYIGVAGSTTTAKIAQTLYCEKIGMTQTPEVEIGAYISHVEGTKSVPFTLSIKRADSGEYASCGATAIGSGPNERIACIPQNFHINQDGDYFVCIKATNAPDINKYEIFYEQDSPCGFTGTYSGTYDYDFEIFARQAKYAPAITFTLNNAELAKAGNPINIESYVKNYVSSMYNNNCSKGCVIPVKIYSGVEQQISISNALIEYIAGISKDTEGNIYDIAEAPSQISSSGFRRLYLDDSGFKAPAEYDEYILSVTLGSDELFSEEINVSTEAVPDIKFLNPTITGVKYPTKFTVEVGPGKNITKYIWNFGDGSVAQTTTIKEATHTYTTAGNYTLSITISDNRGMNSSKEFSITVAPASQIVPTLLNSLETDLANIKTQIEDFSDFEKKSINEALKLDIVETNLTQMSDAASKAVSEAEYEAILGVLLIIKIPQVVAKTIYSEGIAFYPETDNIHLEILKQAGGGDYTGKENKYKEAILEWNVANTNAILTYSEISMIYENSEDSSLKVFDFNVANEGPDTAYFIIKDMKNLLFKGDYSEKKEDGYVYIELRESRNIAFSTTESVDFITLPAFISPSISKLTLTTEWSPFEETGQLKKWIVFSIIVILVLFAAAVAWIILQLWYKRRYENYLFKNRNNLYNLVNFIEIEKKKGTEENEIKEKLKKAGWNSEQLRYAFRKYEGKTTGLPEIIPLGKIIDEIRQIQEELAKKKEKNNLPNKNQGSNISH